MRFIRILPLQFTPSRYLSAEAQEGGFEMVKMVLGITPDLQVELLEPMEVVEMNGGAPKEHVEHSPPPKPAKQSDRSCGAKVVTWLGLRWFGVPWPKRLRWNPYQMEFEVVDMPGCGCIIRLKRLVNRIRYKARRVRHAARVVMS